MKARNPSTGNLETVYVKALDSMPVGTEVDFDGTSADIPTGWEQVTDPESYSTSEVKTNKTWINNKPIYRKVYTDVSVNQNYSLDISDLSVDEITDIKYKHYDGTNTFDFNNRYGVWVGNEQFCRIYWQTNNINSLILDTAFTGSVFKYIILEYTKTTD